MHGTLSLDDVKAAAVRLRGQAFETPLLSFKVLDDAAGRKVWLKPENLQRTGSFKFRGAFNRLSQIPEGERKAGVVACSSGNHAQGVAEAARILGMPAVIVMPEDAPAIKLKRTAEMGARVVTYKRGIEDRIAIAKTICEENGATFVHPYDDRGVIAGQGTIGLEIVRQSAALGLDIEAVAACTGGGGLTSGVALGLEEGLAGAVVYTCEPAGFDDYARSLASGRREVNASGSGSVCDAILTESPGELSFEVLTRRKARGLVVSDDEALAAVAFAFRELKLVVEPGGAVALASVLFGKMPAGNGQVVAILSGGNIDPETLARALAV
ncbi:threonine/serine dehydratase [Pannonibacter indicus]|uniref:threonine ammonia-lyase n=1 Tax=Pannonibacter indicus TaxID=466044 RepID=UPI00391909C6